jgi:hypothetical protein
LQQSFVQSLQAPAQQLSHFSLPPQSHALAEKVANGIVRNPTAKTSLRMFFILSIGCLIAGVAGGTELDDAGVVAE